MGPHLLLRLPESAEQPVDWLLWQEHPEHNTGDACDKSANNAVSALASGRWRSVTEFIEMFAETAVCLSDGNSQPLSSFSSILPTTVLVSSVCVTLHALEVQGRLTPAVRQSLVWRLEEEVSEDGENLHLSVLDQQEDQAQIALVSKNMMALWQTWLQQAGVNYKRWCPDALMLPWQEGGCTIMAVDSQVLARYGSWKIGACEPEWQPLFEESLRQAQPDIAIGDIDSSNLQSPLLPFVETVATTRVNLLQGAWQLPSPWKQYLRPLLPAAIMGGVLLCLMMVNMLLNIQQLDQQTQTLQQQAQNTYLQLFPNERIVNLQAQMRQKLAALQPADTTTQTLPQILVRITPVLNAFPSLKADAMSYDSNRQNLRIQAEADSFEFFSQLRERFQQEMDKVAGEPLVLTIDALEQVGNKVSGQLVISGESS